MKPSIPIVASLCAATFMLCGLTAQAQSSIANIYPDGANMFQPSSTLTFTASSPAGVTNVTVGLTGTSLYTGSAILKNLTTAHGLNISGPSTAWSVSANLASNTLYSANIQVQSGDGSTASQTVTFDTIMPTYTWEAEDWDYTSNGISGLFIDNPQTNMYAGLLTTDNVDAHNANGPSPYRIGGDAGGGGLSTEGNGDQVRLPWKGTGLTDYDCGYTDGGDWANYTRHYPAGTYNLFVRAANGSGADHTECADITVTSGNAVIASTGSGTGPYKYGAKNNGWQTYSFQPVTDTANQPITITFDGTQATLQVLQNQAGNNMNFFLLVPTNTPQISTVLITNVFPNGAYQFQQTNLFTFSASSPVYIDPNFDVTLQLSATNISGAGFVTNLTTANGLVVTVKGTNITATATLTTDMVYTAFIQVSDANGVPASQTVKFNTINPNYYTFEAEDWDYSSGQFINNPQINAYRNLDGVLGVDFNGPAANGSPDLNRLGIHCESASDIPRLGLYTLQPDGTVLKAIDPATGGNYIDDDANPSGGAWASYTRNYPEGTYNIYVRAASAGITGTEADCGSFSIVTSGQGSPSQTVSKLGTYSMINSGGWQTYVWRPVMDAGGNLARFVADGSAITLRYTYDSANANQGFYMLVPSANIPFKPFVSNFQPDGSQPFQYTNKITFTVNSSVGLPQNNIVLNVDGANVTGMTISGSPSQWNVSFPISANGFHKVLVSVTDPVGSTVSTNLFDTFDPNTYTFEAEDYDYTSDGITGGQFIDNPQVNAYANLGGVINVDDHWDYNVGVGYRPSSGTGEGAAFENCSDWVRPQYAGGLQNYDLGHNDGGNWANYTRTYPAGKYNVWMRMASPNGNPSTTDAARLSLVTGGWGTTSQTIASVGTFTTPNTGDWGAYNGGWAPLLDANGNYVQWTADGNTNTLRVTVDNGGYNVDFFALVPADTTRPTIANLYPNGLLQFQGTNALTFDAISSGGISTNSIIVTLNGVVVSNLVFTGSSTNWHVSASLQPNIKYSVSISFSGLLGSAYSTSYSFDTYSSTNYQWEAEDWDYTSNGVSGLFFDNPQVDSYLQTESLENVDMAQINASTSPFQYRPNDINLVPGTDFNGQSRPQFTGTNQDYRVDWFGYGSWCNYTRHYPAGTYYVVGRFTEGQAATVATLSKVTSGWGTTIQTASLLGTFQIPLDSWNNWDLVYLTDNNNNLVKVTFDGSKTTLKFAGNPVADGDPTINADYFMLLPAPAVVSSVVLIATVQGANIHISFATQTGWNYQVLYKNNLTDSSWTPLGGALSGNNAVQSATDTVSGGSRFYRVQIQ